jgi:hypothetical protein
MYNPILIYRVPEVVTQQRCEYEHLRPPDTKKKNAWSHTLHSPMLLHVIVIKYSQGQMSSTFVVHEV